MMKTLKSLAALLALLAAAAAPGRAATTLPLNTGYDHSIYAPYPSPGPPVGTPSPSATQDMYWINIATYPTTGPAVGPAYVIQPSLPWAGVTMPNAHWVGARNTFSSVAPTSFATPGYTIFRKCFCLSEGYKNARLNFQVRADDSLQVWLNTQLNQLLAPSPGNFQSYLPARSGGTDKGFRAGRNCLYVLVEDTGGAVGFIMSGDVSADGLLPAPARGVEQTFGQCSCGAQ
ncbi:MAG TPA: hypothetical protein VF668_18045 [Pyrinomonadaceae bacterium]|jgi:hypothetical protein